MLNSFHRVTLAEKTEEIFPKQVLVHFDSQHIPCYEICLILETPPKNIVTQTARMLTLVCYHNQSNIFLSVIFTWFVILTAFPPLYLKRFSKRSSLPEVWMSSSSYGWRFICWSRPMWSFLCQ